MEYLGYFFLAIVVIIWIIAMIVGMIVAFPFGIIGLIAITGVGLLLIKVITDRLKNKEDDHYSENVDK